MSCAEYDDSTYDWTEPDDMNIFPRDVWPQETYYVPGCKMTDLVPSLLVRFAAQQASRRLMGAVEAGTLQNVKSVDFDMAVLDVVIMLNDQVRSECVLAHTTLTDSVEAWHKWLRDATDEIAGKGSLFLKLQIPDGDKVLAGWGHVESSPAERGAGAAAEQRSQLIVNCMDQLWERIDTREAYSRPPLTAASSGVLGSYGPGDLEKNMVWYGRMVELNGEQATPSRSFTMTWDGKRVLDVEDDKDNDTDMDSDSARDASTDGTTADESLCTPTSSPMTSSPMSYRGHSAAARTQEDGTFDLGEEVDDTVDQASSEHDHLRTKSPSSTVSTCRSSVA
ncbi:uncharacterized protein CcaverHIS019_0500010 [Cutaneotrichosporon cavernicola]|uniref:Uncharacterized protein n=1 Tax=Cutaneotrichosporon cavernicola TaxID=279322 RepID=A0AA48QWG8_9TREE|nr:uncharacterized protein CcaverHIS019_0500010 [Cutaneotrichosporon cavernicola]BEI92373.1 hypothetical protein CcaverHIS019_0500010 [Cutaneotrichosporon cavernicola]BEJ00144.1 hypothetical protein CcaverHIS631_0500010 [Cutaneotrichosporon cavernicola]BEJ07916.1 hypothetical protein CcaverHIS641_0500010 [Cutaneotrichosporon cavernicola]